MLCQLHQWILAAKDWTVMTVTTQTETADVLWAKTDLI